MFKDELGGKIIIEFAGIRPRAYAYLMDNDSQKKKARGTKKCVINRKIMYENYKDFLFNKKIILKLQQRFKSDHQIVHTEQINKIELSSNDDKRLQTFHGVTTYPHGRNIFKVWEVRCLWL